jgi:hypothetical protein
MTTKEDTAAGPGNRVKKRSPNAPSIPLSAAIERARTLYEKEKGHAVTVDVMAKHWDLSPTGSTLIVTMGAMRQFGLLETVPSSGGRKALALTGTATRILRDLDPKSAERKAAIREAALNPKIHQQLWQKWGREFPSQLTFRSHLIFDLRFTDSGADEFQKQYRATLQYAGLLDSDKIETNENIGPAQPDAEDAGEADAVSPSASNPVLPPAPPPVSGDRGSTHRDLPLRSTGMVVDPEAPYVDISLPGGNRLEIRLARRVTSDVFRKIQKLLEIMETSFVEEADEESRE